MPDNRNQGQNWIRLDLRLAIYLRDGMCCVWCGASGEPYGYGLTLDHVGRTNLPKHLVTACNSCNARRADKPLMAEERVRADRYRWRRIDRAAGRALLIKRREFRAAMRARQTAEASV